MIQRNGSAHKLYNTKKGRLAQFQPEADGPLAQARKMYFVYFIKSLRNDKVYVGRSDKDPKVRTEEHNQGTNTWTRQNGPFKLIYYESFICREDSIKKEEFYKTGIGRKIKSAICKVMDD